jgi:hypothetical protein
MHREKHSAREWIIHAACFALIAHWKTSLLAAGRRQDSRLEVFWHPSGWSENPRNGDTTLAMKSQQAHDRAEASFKKKEPQGQKVNAVGDAERLALREKTARLRALRLSRDAAGATEEHALPGKKCPSDPS